GKKVGYPYDVPLRYDAYVDYYNVESVNVKQEIMREFPYLGEEKFRLIYGCIDAESFKPAAFAADPAVLSLKAPDALNILFVGRLDRQKQPLVMADTARRLRDRGVPFLVHVIGDGSLESQKNELMRFIETEGLSGSIRLYGDQPLEKLPSWYEVGDVLLLTSAWEGIPMVLYQAMLTGLVCVAPDVGGVAELVRPEHGFLVKDSKDSEAYAEILARLAGDPGLRRDLGLKAADFIRKNFDIHVVREAYGAFYTEAVERRRNAQGRSGETS
ncbi:MAG: glycosyltransferase family 4 protein, partial [Deltaproteobacteria bacterium]|nr:glycosyltransferase family 4 protein [Deltaproteobacteria bacterium]